MRKSARFYSKQVASYACLCLPMVLAMLAARVLFESDHKRRYRIAFQKPNPDAARDVVERILSVVEI